MRPSHRAASESLPDAARSPRTTRTSAFPSSAPAWRRRLPPAAAASPDRIRLRIGGGNQRHAANHLLMLSGELKRDAATHRIAEHVDPVVAELLEHASHVLAHVH